MPEILMSYSVKICKTSSQFYYLVVTIELSSQSLESSLLKDHTCFVFTIDTVNGSLYYNGLQNIDLFPDTESATRYVNKNVNDPEWTVLGRSLIGATIFDKNLIIAYIKTDVNIATIRGEWIKVIRSIDYEIIPLKDSIPQSSLPLLDFPVAENHFYCNYMDLSKPFPYPEEIDTSSPYCWNRRWLNPFDSLHALAACAVIYQGYATSLYLDKNADPNITYIIKRSCRNPGTRYVARGLNDYLNPANECQCELIFYKDGKYYAQSWMRGSIPVKWKTVLTTSISAPQHIVEENATSDTPTYFLNLKALFKAKSIHAICMLHDDPNNGEYDLLTAYQKGVKEANSVGGNIQLQIFDLNSIIKEHGSDKTRQTLIFSCKPDIEASGFTVLSEDGQIEHEQSILFRFNCADSLDRTNLATFYYALILTSFFAYETNTFHKPDTEAYHDPIAYLNQDIIDFLGQSFITSGDIISQMYTNTPSIKTTHIRNLLSKSSSQVSDSAISIKRRLQNVVFDPQRQVVIDLWTDDSFKGKRINLDQQHLSIVIPTPERSIKKTNVSHQILECTPQVFVFDESTEKDLVIMLPESFLLCTVSFFIYPHLADEIPYINLSCGPNYDNMYIYFVMLQIPSVNEPRWIKYDLRNIKKQSLQAPIDPNAATPCDFIRLHFSNGDSKFSLGNIRIEVKKPKPRAPYFAIKPPDNSRPNSFNDETASVMLSKGKDITPGSLVQFELYKFLNGITDIERNQVLTKLGINPALVDLPSRMLQRNQSNCAFCNARLSSNTKVCFLPKPQYPTIYNKILDGSRTTQRSSFVCPKCATALQVSDSQLPKSEQIIYKDQIVSVNEGIAFRRPISIKYTSGDISLLNIMRIYYFSSGEGDINSLIQGTNGFWKSQSNKTNFIIGFAAFVQISQLIILLKEPAALSISVVTPDNKVILNQKVEETQQIVLSIDMCQLPPVQSYSISINSESLLVFQYINVLGQIHPKPYATSSPPPSPQTLKFASFSENKYEWNPETNTQTFYFQKNERIKGFMARVDPNIKPYPSSMIFAAYNGKQYINSNNIIFPEVEEKTDLLYEFMLEIDQFDRICVFYLDRITSIEPHKIMFL